MKVFLFDLLRAKGSSPRLMHTVVFLSLLSAYMPELAAQAVMSNLQSPLSTTVNMGPDTIDLATLAVSFEIPLYAKSGRGISLDLSISHTNSLYSNGAAFPISAGWQTALQNTTGSLTYSVQGPGAGYNCASGGVVTKYYTYTDMDSWPHYFTVPTSVTSCTTAITPPFVTELGGGGLQLNTSAQTILTPSGEILQPPVGVSGSGQLAPYGSRADANGNTLTVTPTIVTDTLGVPLQIANYSGPGQISVNSSGIYPQPPSEVYTYVDSNGVAQHITINYTVYGVGDPDITCTSYHDSGSGAYSLISSIILANGTSYSFTYEPYQGNELSVFALPNFSGSYTTGRIASMTLPTGGTISYTYGPGSYDCKDSGVDSLTRNTPDGTWTYTRSVSGNIGQLNVTTTTTDPLNVSNVDTFFMIGYDAGAFGNYAYLPTSHAVYPPFQGPPSAQPTFFMQTCYNGFAPPCQNESYSTLPASTTSYKVSSIDTYTSYDGTTPAHLSTQFNSSMMPVEVDEYAYGSASPQRKTLTSYLSLNGIVSNKPLSITITDGTGNIASQTVYGYDESQAQATTGVPQHSAVSGERGNLTSVKKWNNLSNLWLTTTFQNYDTGYPLSMTDPANHPPVVWSYSDSWGRNQSACNPPGNTMAFATSMTDPAGHTSSSSYEPCAGLQVAARSPNDIANNRSGTLYSYDLMNNPTEVRTPDGGDSQTTYGGYALPITITTTTSQSPNPPLVVATTEDSLGRPILSQLTSDPFGIISVTRTYDAKGRPLTVSNPYRSAADSSYGFSTSLYDEANRPLGTRNPDGTSAYVTYAGPVSIVYDESSLKKEQVRDSLGRLVSVFEPDANNNLTLETDYAYDLLDNLTQIDQWGGPNGSANDHSRHFSYDSLSRLVAAYNPEETFVQPNPQPGYTQYPARLNCVPNGPWSRCYTYDADSKMLTLTDNRGVVTTYGRDNLERTVSISYSNDPASTPASCFTYDTPQVGDLNPIGFLTAEWTQSPPCSIGSTTPPSNAITQRQEVGHDPLGRVLTENLCPYGTCNTPYVLSYSYDAAGNMISWNNGLSGASAITLSAQYDGAARTSVLSSSVINNAAEPSILFQANSQTATALGSNPYSAVGLAAAQKGIVPGQQTSSLIETDTFDSRLRLTSESVSGQASPDPSGTITILGTDGETYHCGGRGCVTGAYVYDSVTANITVGSFSTSVTYYGPSDSVFASEIAAALNVAASPVTATTNGSQVVLASKVQGAAGDYAVSMTMNRTSSSDFAQSTASSTLGSYTPLYSYTVSSGGYSGDSNVVAFNDSNLGSWTASYDYLGRLVTNTAVSGQYQGLTLGWTYDSFGNRQSQTPSGSSSTFIPPAQSATYSADNQVIVSNTLPYGLYYDGAGHVTNDGFNIYLYDGGGRLCATRNLVSQATTGYVYDARGRRVASGSLSTLACPSVSSFSVAKLSLVDSLEHQATELDNVGNWKHSNVFLNGSLLATYDPIGLHFQISDPKGNRRVQLLAGPSATVSVELQCSNLPFGDGLSCTGNGQDATEHHFTGKERDVESGNDYFGARYYGSSMGQWMAPDLPFADQSPEDPQSWNLYGYVRNNPLNSIDTNGRITYLIGGTHHKGSEWDPDSALGSEMRGFFEDDSFEVQQIPWSGGGFDPFRAVLANRIVSTVKAWWKTRKPGEQLNFVCHSHGCNGLAAALPILMADGYFVNNMVTLGMPMQGDYGYPVGSVGSWYNVYSNEDWVQKLGGDIPGSGGRTNPAAINIQVHTGSGHFASHSALHNSQDVRSIWEFEIMRYESSNGGGGGDSTEDRRSAIPGSGLGPNGP